LATADEKAREHRKDAAFRWGRWLFECLGRTTAEDQMRVDRRWRNLSKIRAIIRFISCEPALGPLRLTFDGSVPDWLIWGGESGAGARPVNPQWVRNIIADCRRFDVAPFHEQWGSYWNNPLVVEHDSSRGSETGC
jgi:protein gp37